MTSPGDHLDSDFDLVVDTGAAFVDGVFRSAAIGVRGASGLGDPTATIDG